MRRYATLLIVLSSLLAIACGSTSPLTSPSSVATGSHALANFAPFDSPGVQCPSDAPLFRAEANPYGHLDVDVQPMPKADSIRVYVARRSAANVFEPVSGSPFVLDGGRTYIEIPATDGVYSIQVATVTCGEQRNLSDVAIVVLASQDAPPVTSTPTTPIDPDLPVDPIDPPTIPGGGDDDSKPCKNGSSGDHNHDGHRDCGKGKHKY